MSGFDFILVMFLFASRCEAYCCIKAVFLRRHWLYIFVEYGIHRLVHEFSSSTMICKQANDISTLVQLLIQLFIVCCLNTIPTWEVTFMILFVCNMQLTRYLLLHDKYIIWVNPIIVKCSRIHRADMKTSYGITTPILDICCSSLTPIQKNDILQEKKHLIMLFIPFVGPWLHILFG